MVAAIAGGEAGGFAEWQLKLYEKNACDIFVPHFIASIQKTQRNHMSHTNIQTHIAADY